MKIFSKILRAAFLFLFLCALSCATGEDRLSIHYTPPEKAPLVIPENEKFVLYLAPVEGDASVLWYTLGKHKWVLEKAPTLIVHEAVTTELERMGISVTDDPGESQARLKVEIRWFAPWGHAKVTACMILSLALSTDEGVEPLWRDKIEAGTFLETPAWQARGKAHYFEKVASEALSKTVRQIGWNSDFSLALREIQKREKLE